MHSAHATFAGVLLLQPSLLRVQTWWGNHTRTAPSGNIINDIHDHPEAKQLGGDWTDFHAGPPLNLD